MIIKKYKTASESSFNLDEPPDVNRTFNSLKRELIKNSKSPSSFIKELESFIKRNSLATVKSRNKEINHCCPACFKAHAIIKADSLNLDRRIIDNVMSWQEGHSDYYLDRGRLKKITTSNHLASV